MRLLAALALLLLAMPARAAEDLYSAFNCERHPPREKKVMGGSDVLEPGGIGTGLLRAPRRMLSRIADPIRATARSARAAALFHAAEAKYALYREFRFSNDKTLTLDLNCVLKAKLTLSQEYTKVLDVGDLYWGVASWVRIGMLPVLLSEKMHGSASPAVADNDQQPLYDGNRVSDGPAEWMLSAGVELLTMTLERAQEFDIENEWTAEARRQLKDCCAIEAK